MNINLRRLTRGTLVLLVTGMTAWPAYPAGLRCRSDPAVVLTDGTIIDLSADFDGALWDVKEVHYTLHVPCKTKALLVVRTPNWPGTLETFDIISDSTPGRYDTSTTVHTKTGGAGVTAHLIVKSLKNLIALDSENGRDGQPIRVLINTR